MKVTERHRLAALHPTRARILSLMNGRPLTPRDLAVELDETLGAVSYHVRYLKDAGVLKLVATYKVRGAVAHRYKIAKPKHVAQMADDLERHAQWLRGER